MAQDVDCLFPALLRSHSLSLFPLPSPPSFSLSLACIATTGKALAVLNGEFSVASAAEPDLFFHGRMELTLFFFFLFLPLLLFSLPRPFPLLFSLVFFF